MNGKIFHLTITACGFLLSLAFVANIYALTISGTPLYQFLTSIGLAATTFTGAAYIFTGYTKEKSAGFFKIFMALYTVSEWFGIIGAGSNRTVNMMLLVLSFGCSMVLTISKDLGKIKSLVMSGTIVATVLGRLVISAITSKLPAFGIRPLTKLLLGVTVLILVIAKYHDKTERRTKLHFSE